jgi:hypothetical protein
MDGGRILFPGEVHLVDIVGSVALQEGIIGILDTSREPSRTSY